MHLLGMKLLMLHFKVLMELYLPMVKLPQGKLIHVSDLIIWIKRKEVYCQEWLHIYIKR
jgi:hypothetical protein